MIEIVRNMGSAKTHLADIDRTDAALMAGAVYRKPPEDTQALCGVRIWDGVVMRPGSRMKCQACTYINSKEG